MSQTIFKNPFAILTASSFVVAMVYVGALGGQQAGSTQSPVATDLGISLQASAINRVQPEYPPLAKAARVSGRVVVEVTVDELGNVTSARAISGHPLLK